MVKVVRRLLEHNVMPNRDGEWYGSYPQTLLTLPRVRIEEFR